MFSMYAKNVQIALKTDMYLEKIEKNTKTKKIREKKWYRRHPKNENKNHVEACKTDPNRSTKVYRNYSKKLQECTLLGGPASWSVKYETVFGPEERGIAWELVWQTQFDGRSYSACDARNTNQLRTPEGYAATWPAHFMDFCCVCFPPVWGMFQKVFSIFSFRGFSILYIFNFILNIFPYILVF